MSAAIAVAAGAGRRAARHAMRRNADRSATALDPEKRFAYSPRLTWDARSAWRSGCRPVAPREYGWVCTGAAGKLPCDHEAFPRERMLLGMLRSATRSPAHAIAPPQHELSPPIAPGTFRSPLPPWDAVFPGAFFCASPEIAGPPRPLGIATSLRDRPARRASRRHDRRPSPAAAAFQTSRLRSCSSPCSRCSIAEGAMCS
jgi:hypothetical protein